MYEVYRTTCSEVKLLDILPRVGGTYFCNQMKFGVRRCFRTTSGKHFPFVPELGLSSCIMGCNIITVPQNHPFPTAVGVHLGMIRIGHIGTYWYMPYPNGAPCG